MNIHEHEDWGPDISDVAFMGADKPRAALIDNDKHNAEIIATAILKTGIEFTPDVANRWVAEGLVDNNQLNEICELLGRDF